ncbi:MAG: hypothetical protein ACP5M4_02675, partial [Acidobacteriaceae bacterium]
RQQKFDNSGNGRRQFQAGNLRKNLLKNSLGQLFQGLKPNLFCCTYGPTKVVPLLQSLWRVEKLIAPAFSGAKAQFVLLHLRPD